MQRIHDIVEPMQGSRNSNSLRTYKNSFRAAGLALAMSLLLSGCLTGQYMSSRGGDDVHMVEITPDMVRSPENLTTMAELPAEVTQYRPQSYEIQPGDALLVTVWDHPELTTPAGSQQQVANNQRLVYPDGTMFYPYVGTIKVAGMTIEELRSTLTTRLSKYLRNPQLDVAVAGNGGQLVLEGAFTNTAPQGLNTVPLTVSKAVGAAGINVEQADLSGLTLIRDGQRYNIDMDAMHRRGNSADIYLKPGDRLYLPFNDRKQVYVLGEVTRPQALTFKTSDMSLTQALGRAGGLDQITSNGDAVYVIRGVDAANLTPQTPPSTATVYHLQAKSPAAFAVASSFSLRAGDVVFVGPAGITRWNRFLSQLLPLSAIVNNAARAQSNITD
ncbi:polysaccharide biosynthesis/export family protein [Lysobacter terrae]